MWNTIQEIPEETHDWNGETSYSTYQLVQKKMRNVSSDVTQTNIVWQEIQDSIMQVWQTNNGIQRNS